MAVAVAIGLCCCTGVGVAVGIGIWCPPLPLEARRSQPRSARCQPDVPIPLSRLREVAPARARWSWPPRPSTASRRSMVATAPVRRVAPPHVAPPPHSWSTPFAAPSEELVKFAAWPSCNDPQYAAAVGVAARQRLCLTDGGRLKPLPWRSSDPEADLFDGDTLQNKLGRALAAVEAIDRKEFFEAFEVFAKTRSSSKRRRWSRSAAATRCSACSSPLSAARSSA